jgi:hypothetical protein
LTCPFNNGFSKVQLDGNSFYLDKLGTEFRDK